MLLLSALVLMCISCEDGINPGFEDLLYYESASITEDHPYVSDGSSIVIHRHYVAEDKEDIQDDEYAEDVFFQIPSSISSFSYTDSEINDLHFLFKQYCYCGLAEGVEVEAGTITGNKLGNGWDINVDVSLRFVYRYDEDSTFLSPETHQIAFAGNFQKSSKPSGN